MTRQEFEKKDAIAQAAVERSERERASIIRRTRGERRAAFLDEIMRMPVMKASARACHSTP